MSSSDIEALASRHPIETLAPIEHGKFRISTAGLTVLGTPTYEEWEEVGHVLAVFTHGLPFIVGDWIRLGEQLFGELAAQVIDARNWRPETVRAYVWMAEKVPVPNRMLDRGLSVKHHMAVAALPPQQQRTWLTRALGDGDPEQQWTASRLAQAVHAGQDLPVTGWLLLVEFPSEARRDKARKAFELDGLSCRAVDRRKAR